MIAKIPDENDPLLERGSMIATWAPAARLHSFQSNRMWLLQNWIIFRNKRMLIYHHRSKPSRLRWNWTWRERRFAWLGLMMFSTSRVTGRLSPDDEWRRLGLLTAAVVLLLAVVDFFYCHLESNRLSTGKGGFLYIIFRMEQMERGRILDGNSF